MKITIPMWLKISLMLSVFGFLKEFRPSEPYVFEYLTGWKNLTLEETTQKIYPVGTYAYLGLLVIVFLITDICRYKPLIVILGCCGIIIWSLLLWTSSVPALQTMEVFYGLFMACEVAYYTYIYAKVPKDKYQVVTSHTRAAALFGRFSASLIAQLLISFNAMNIADLNYITFGVMIVATIWSIAIPPVQKSIYFNQSPGMSLKTSDPYVNAIKLLWKHFITAYSSFHVIKWSFWWALATCGFIQVVNYMQPLWGLILDENNPNRNYNMDIPYQNLYSNTTADDPKIWNGAVEATLTLLGAAMALIAGALRVDWAAYGELTMAVCSVIGGCFLFASASTKNIWICYMGYVVFGILYQFMITVANSEVAKKLCEDSYGLIFGINTLLALLFQTILTIIVVSDDGLAIQPRGQYYIYASYNVILGLIFLVIGITKLVRSRNRYSVH